MIDYDPADWFWIVGGNTTRAWSSAAKAYVATWPADQTTQIASEDELWTVLREAGVLKVKIAKNMIWRRMTNAEAEIADALLSAQPARLRRLWVDTPEFIHTTDELFTSIATALGQVFGAERTAQILEPTE